jgi:hypothetical protein
MVKFYFSFTGVLANFFDLSLMSLEECKNSSKDGFCVEVDVCPLFCVLMSQTSAARNTAKLAEKSLGNF